MIEKQHIHIPGGIGIWNLVFEERGKLRHLKKKASHSKRENQQ